MTTPPLQSAPSVLERATVAKAASRRLAHVSAEVKNRALFAVAGELERQAEAILSANAADCAEARAGVERGEMSRELFERLVLDSGKLAGMADSVRAVAALPDPAGRVLARTLLDDGLELHKVSCPLGVLAVIFESRPDAVTQIGALALKSGNAVILKGGREAARSSAALVSAMARGLAEEMEIPAGALTLLSSRDEVAALLALDSLVDLVIPRGGNELVRKVRESTRIPVLGHAEGICHIFVDAAADTAMAVDLCLDAKAQYPAACNAAETFLLHETAAARVLPPLLERLAAAGVEVRACAATRALAPRAAILPATEEDWHTEYCAPIVSIRVVPSLEAAIEHVNQYGSGHTDAIVTDDAEAARVFLERVDSAGVYHNASTRFADGFRYGFGAEVGISTSKLHARGPVGLEGLVTYKYKLYGKGHLVASYAGPGARKFLHRKMGEAMGPAKR